MGVRGREDGVGVVWVWEKRNCGVWWCGGMRWDAVVEAGMWSEKGRGLGVVGPRWDPFRPTPLHRDILRQL